MRTHAPELQPGSGPQQLSAPTAAGLRALARTLQAQPEAPLRPSTPVAASGGARPAAIDRPSSRLRTGQPSGSAQPPALHPLQGTQAGQWTAALQPERAGAAQLQPSTQQSSGGPGNQVLPSTAKAAGPSGSDRASQPGHLRLAVAACSPPLAVLLLLLVGGATEAPAGGPGAALACPSAWWLAATWAASAALLCTHAAYFQAGWRWAVALDALCLLLLAGASRPHLHAVLRCALGAVCAPAGP